MTVNRPEHANDTTNLEMPYVLGLTTCITNENIDQSIYAISQPALSQTEVETELFDSMMSKIDRLCQEKNNSHIENLEQNSCANIANLKETKVHTCRENSNKTVVKTT